MAYTGFFSLSDSYNSEKELGKDDIFKTQTLAKNDTQNISCPSKPTYGVFTTQEEYLEAVDLLIASTQETQHRNTYLQTFVLPYLEQRTTMLDIGIGNGDLTKIIGENFSHLTLIDINQESLDKIGDYHWLNHNPITKILGSIETIELSDQKYDFIVFSHTLYYIDPEMRNAVIDKLYHLLNPRGSLLLIFNESGTRGKMTEDFGGKNFIFNDVIVQISKYDSIKYQKFSESITTEDICKMVTICDVCLKDSGTTTNFLELESYIQNNFLAGENNYVMSMSQHIAVIEHS